MRNVLIPDTSCLIFLSKIGRITLFQALYQNVVTTEDVAAEHISAIPQWITIENPKDKHFQTELEKSVDKGEASIMTLAWEKSDCHVSMDDRKARKIAIELNLKVTGTLGIIYKAKKAGHLQSVKKAIQALKAVNFRISDKIEAEILRLAGE